MAILLAFVKDETRPTDQRLVAAEALGWYNLYHAKASIVKALKETQSDDPTLMNEIQKEHGRELVGEFQRKFELVRWGIWFEQVSNCSDYGTMKNNMLPCHEYYPIPDKEVALSGGVLTNDEYKKYGM